jgi:hypothetical protein
MFFFSAFDLLHWRSVLVLQALGLEGPVGYSVVLCSGDTLYQISPLKNGRLGL